MRILVLVCILLFGSCKSRLDKSEYLKWFSEHKENTVERKMGSYTFKLVYLPQAYYVLKNNSTIKTNAFSEEIKKIDGLQYYELNILDSNGDLIESAGSPELVYSRLSYFSFSFQNDLYLVDGTDTLDCKLYHFVRSYDLKNDKKILLAFKDMKRESLEDKTLIVEPKPLATGIIKIHLAKEAIEKLPELSL